MKGRWIGKAVATVATGLLLGMLLVGCKPEPCPVAEDMVESARAQAREAQRAADDAVSRKSDLESQIQSKRQRVRELEERKVQIEAELNELLGT